MKLIMLRIWNLHSWIILPTWPWYLSLSILPPPPLLLTFTPTFNILTHKSLTFLTPLSRYSCHVLLSSLNAKLYDFTCSKYTSLPCVARAVIRFFSPKSICKYFSLLLLGAAHQAPTRLLRWSSSLYRRPEEAGAYHPPPWNCFMYIV